MSSAAGTASRLARVILEGEPLTRLSALQQEDRDQAVRDLTQESSFAPTHQATGPYILHLSIQEGRLVLNIRDPPRPSPAGLRPRPRSLSPPHQGLRPAC